MKRALIAASLALVLGGVAGCSVQFLSDDAVAPVANACKVDADCDTNASCTGGACFAKSGVIDEVLLEIVPMPTRRRLASHFDHAVGPPARGAKQELRASEPILVHQPGTCQRR
jgi:hypothetical protein